MSKDKAGNNGNNGNNNASDLGSKMDSILELIQNQAARIEQLSNQIDATHEVAVRAQQASLRSEMNEQIKAAADPAPASEPAPAAIAAKETAEEHDGVLSSCTSFVKRNWGKLVVSATVLTAAGGGAYGVMKYRQHKADTPLVEHNAESDTMSDNSLKM